MSKTFDLYIRITKNGDVDIVYNEDYTIASIQHIK